MINRIEEIWDELIDFCTTENILRNLISQEFERNSKELMEMLFLSSTCPNGIKKIAAYSLSTGIEEFSRVFTGEKGIFQMFRQTEGARTSTLFRIQAHIRSLTVESFKKGGKYDLKNNYKTNNEELEAFKEHAKSKIDWWLVKIGKLKWEFGKNSRIKGRTRLVEIIQYEALQAFAIAAYIHEGKLTYGGLYEFKKLFEEFPLKTSIGTYVSAPFTILPEYAQSLLNIVEKFINELNNKYWLSLDLTGSYWLEYDCYFEAKQKLTDYIEFKQRFQKVPKSTWNSAFRCDIDGLLNDLKNKISPIDKFIRKYNTHLKKTEKRQGGFSSKTLEELAEIRKIQDKKYYTISYFSKAPTSNFDSDHYIPSYILLANDKTDIVYKGHPDESEFNDICEYADPEGDAIRNVKDSFRVTKYDQVHHDEFIEAIFKDRHKTGVFAVEIPVWYYDEATGWLFTGHIDAIKIVGKIVYIVDYKPDYVINLEHPDSVANPFFDAVPQIATYAIIFEKMFHDVLQKHGYEVRCAILNKDDKKLFNPKRALALYTAMYELKWKETPPWRLLVPDALVKYYKDAYQEAKENGSI